MENLEFKRIGPNEWEAVDPMTKGKWRVVSPHALSEDGALVAITQTIENQDIRPAQGTTLTVVFEIRIQEEGEALSSIPGTQDRSR